MHFMTHKQEAGAGVTIVYHPMISDSEYETGCNDTYLVDCIVHPGYRILACASYAMLLMSIPFKIFHPTPKYFAEHSKIMR